MKRYTKEWARTQLIKDKELLAIAQDADEEIFGFKIIITGNVSFYVAYIEFGRMSEYSGGWRNSKVTRQEMNYENTTNWITGRTQQEHEKIG